MRRTRGSGTWSPARAVHSAFLSAMEASSMPRSSALLGPFGMGRVDYAAGGNCGPVLTLGQLPS